MHSRMDEIKKIAARWHEIPDSCRIPIPTHQQEYLVDGELIAVQGETKPVVSPIWLDNGEGSISPTLIGSFPSLTTDEALQALDAAEKAYNYGRGYWPMITVEKRIQHIRDFAQRMPEVKKEVVNLIMWEIGKSLKDAEKEFDRTVDYIIDTINALKELDRVSSKFEMVDGIIGQIRRAPLGVALCMGPFNYPLNETFTTLIPALIMGNTVIFKPPRLGVLLHQPFLKLFLECFPKGVINTVYGDGRKVVGPLMESGKVNVFAFIGSSKSADALKKQHPFPHRLRSVLGLEAKNPAIILQDADLSLAVKECILGSLSFNGQRCTALKNIFVHKSIVDSFIRMFVDAVESLTVGMPWDPNVQITPLPEDHKTDYLTELMMDAKAHGAQTMNPSGGVVHQSFFYPAVMYPVNPKMRLFHEEQFGPIIPIIPFEDIEEPIQHIIDSNYGQQLSIFGKDPDTISQLIDPLVNQVCRVNLNAQCQRGPDVFPFTGRKDSAEGTLSVSDALRVFSIRTLVATKDSDENKAIISTIVRERKSNFLDTDFIL